MRWLRAAMMSAVSIVLACACVAERGRVASVDAAIEALLSPHATVASVASVLGSIKGERAVGFEVESRDTQIAEVLIGSADSDAATAVPTYVEIRPAVTAQLNIENVTRRCGAWRQFPNTPSASPFLYGCEARGSTKHITVKVLMTLSDDLHSPHTTVQRIVLQRGVW